jgi:hypothetical protein
VRSKLTVFWNIPVMAYISLEIYLPLSLSLSIYIYIWLCSPFGPWSLFQFLNLYAVCRSPLTGDQPVTRPLPAHRRTQTQNKRTQISMPQVGFAPTIPVLSERRRFMPQNLLFPYSGWKYGNHACS